MTTGLLYPQVIARTLNLNWQALTFRSLSALMYDSFVFAKEFAESLRQAPKVYANDDRLRSLMGGELQTTNLNFGQWQNRQGDHWQFLDFFLRYEYPLQESVVNAGREYTRFVASLPPFIRAMTVMSRERELSAIFARILEAPVFQKSLPVQFEAYKYYLVRHVQLDSASGGHADLTGHYDITDAVMPFYEARLEVYVTTIPELKSDN